MAYSPRRRLEDGVIASFARVCQIYGIPASLGRLYALLYVSPAPMSLADLAEATGAAKSTTSVALRRLERYRMVRRLPRGSDRKDYYEALTDPAEIMREWVRHFIQPEMEVGAEMIASIEADLEAAVAAGEYDEGEAGELRRRAGELRASMELGASLVGLLSSGEGFADLLGEQDDSDQQDQEEP